MIAPQPAKTSANVPDRLGDASARERRRLSLARPGGARPTSRCTRWSISSRIRGPSRGPVRLGRRAPSPRTLAGVDRAGVAAAHRDHDVGGLDELVGERLRELLAHVDAELVHRLDHGRVDLLAGRAARRADVDPAVERSFTSPAAIWLRPALCTQTNSTSGCSFTSIPRAWASAFSRSRAKRCASTGTKTLIRASPSRSSDSAM